MKSQLFLLVELILLAGIVIIVTTGSYRLISGDGHIYTYEISNLPLLLERIHTIDGNLVYRYEFQQQTSIEIYDGIIALDRPGRSFKQFQTRTLMNLSNFAVSNTSHIYILKEGDTIRLTLDPKDFDSRFQYVTQDMPDVLFFYSENQVLMQFMRERGIFNVTSDVSNSPLFIFVEDASLDTPLLTYTLDMASVAFHFSNILSDVSLKPIKSDQSILTLRAQDSLLLNQIVRDYGRRT